MAETLAPGTSVSIVARRHDVNANQVFKWRGAMALEPPTAAAASFAMLPVEIVPTADEPHPRARRNGTIEITLAGGAIITPAQLGMLLEGIDWRMPRRTWRPELAG